MIILNPEDWLFASALNGVSRRNLNLASPEQPGIDGKGAGAEKNDRRGHDDDIDRAQAKLKCVRARRREPGKRDSHAAQGDETASDRGKNPNQQRRADCDRKRAYDLGPPRISPLAEET